MARRIWKMRSFSCVSSATTPADFGEWSEYFGRERGTPSADLPGERFVICVQNHDQVGNRALADRLSTMLPFEAVKLAAALMFVAPALPLLFMGEEYGETAPFQFFSDHIDKRIADATREGRRREFAAFAEFEEDIPDPQDPATFERSTLTRERDPRLVCVESPYRALTRPLLAYIDAAGATDPEAVVTVVVPEFVPRHWYEHLLHNHSALGLKAALLFRPRTVVISVPYWQDPRLRPASAVDRSAQKTLR